MEPETLLHKEGEHGLLHMRHVTATSPVRVWVGTFVAYHRLPLSTVKNYQIKVRMTKKKEKTLKKVGGCTSVQCRNAANFCANTHVIIKVEIVIFKEYFIF